MKLTLALSAVVLSSGAWATGTPTPQPTPSTSTSSSQSGAAAGAIATGGNATGGSGGSVGDVSNTANGGAGGAGGSVGNVSSVGVGGGGGVSSSTSQGGAGGSSFAAGGQGGSSESYSGDVSNNIGGSRYLSLPQPVWTSVPTPYGCLVSESKAGAVLFNAFSGSTSSQHSDAVCTTVRMAEAAYLHCQYATAAFLNKRAFELMHPDPSGEFFHGGNPQNLDPVACDDLKRPVLRMSPSVQAPAAIPASTNVRVDMACPAQVARPATRQRVKTAPMCK